MIIVSGATGQLGRAVVDELLKRVSAAQVGVSVRDPARAHELTAKGVRVRLGDYDRPDTLAHAWQGATKVLVVSSNAHGGVAVGHHRAAFEAAQGVGADRVFYTSHVGARAGSPFGPMNDHAATEALLEALPSTAIRNGFYASTVPLMLRGALATGALDLPADGPVSWTTHRDLAEAIAALLTSNTEASTVNLTASQALDFGQIADLVSGVTGRPLVRRTVSDDDHIRTMVARGMDEGMARMGLGIFQASRQGHFSLVAPTLATLLGRAPTGLEDYLRAELEA